MRAPISRGACKLPIHKIFIKSYCKKKTPQKDKRINSSTIHQNQIKDVSITALLKNKCVLFDRKMDDKKEEQDKKEIDNVLACREKA